MTRIQLATGLSLLSMVSFFWRAILDWKLVPIFEYLSEAGETAQFSFWYLVVLGVWSTSLIGTSHGSKIAAGVGIACNLLSAVTLGVFTLLWYCPYPCPSMPPLMDIVVLTNLTLGFGGAAGLIAVVVDKGSTEASAT